MAGSKILILLLVARILGPSGVGIYALAITSVALATSFSSLGMEVSNNYYACKERQAIRSILGNTLIFSVISGGTASLIIAFFLVILHDSVFRSLPPSYTIWVPVATLLESSSMLMVGIVLGLDKFRDYAISTVLRWTILLGFVGGFAVAHKLRVEYLVPLYALSTLVGCVYLLIRILKVCQWRIRTGIGLFRQELRYGLKAYVYNFCHYLNFRFDHFVVAAFYDVTSVGYYSVATQIAESIVYLPKALSNAVLTQTADDVRQGGEATHRGVYWLVGSALILVSIPLMVFASPLIATLFSARLLPAVPPLRILLPGTCFLGLGIVASYQLFGLGRSAEPSIAAAVGTTLTLLLDLVLIPPFGLKGAAVASALAYLAFAVVALYYLSRHLRTSVVELLVPARSGIVREIRRSGLLRRGGAKAIPAKGRM